MYNLGIGYSTPHKYYLFATGFKGFKARYFNSRQAAEEYMNLYCAKYNIKIECTEFDRHERKYSDHQGHRFYVNRI